MNKPSLKWLLLIPLFSILSCSKATPPKEEEIMAPEMQDVACPVIESGKWHAWIDRYGQEKGAYRLNISGEVLLPTPAYDIEWLEGPTDRMAPPSLRLFLKATAQQGMTIQMLTTKTVKHELKTSLKHYRQVSVYCGAELVGQMSDVMLTD